MADFFDEEPFGDEDPFAFDDFEDEEEIPFDLDEAGDGTSNRRFIIILGVMGAVFIISACILLLAFILRPSGPSANDLTNTQVMLALAETQAYDTAVAETAIAAATGTASAEAAAAETAAAEAIASQTASAEAAFATGTAAAEATGTAFAVLTARAEAMLASETPGEPTSTGTLPPTNTPTITPTPTEGPSPEPSPTVEGGEAMPGTGIGDELGLGGGLLLAGLAAFGLLAIMFVARRLRSGAPGM